MSHETSTAMLDRARRVIPGGVNSPVRAFRAVGGDPLFIDRAAGAQIWDVDGRDYVDYVGSWGPMILGHAHPATVSAIQESAARGTSFGAPTVGEIELAEAVLARVPAAERVRLVNSGTEATMSAIRVARGYTRRDHILKFEGCYHGHADHLLVKAGSGVATFGLPDSPGVPEAFAQHTLTVPFNDLAAVEAVFESEGPAIAAVILEPIAGNMGLVPPAPGFLEGLRALTERSGALLIFDEVMTGFRVDYGSAQGRFGIKPDLSCFGKVIGGGMPLGAYSGRADIMDMVAPAGPVYQAGTLSGNPCAVAAGLATLKGLSADTYQQLESLGAQLEDGLHQALRDSPHSGVVQRIGSMLTLYFNDGQPVSNFQGAAAADHKKFAAFFRGMLERGIYLPPSGYESWFVSAAHTPALIEQTVTAAASTLRSMG